ncbi:MAG: hypothetical protein AVO38_05000 [delta proteobacterium ML8_D]|nr:MAG: hypothetical protein AVO38_05000 [delta proteobacterium ML8_D]
MKKVFLSILFIQMMFMPLAPQAFSQCGTLANDLSLVLPCVEYEGAYYKLNFSAYTNPADRAWFYWQFQSIQPVTGGSNCAHLDNNLTITIPCVYLAGRNLAITLEYYEGLYWKLGSQFTINPVEIRSISGDTTELLLPYYSDPDFLAALNATMQPGRSCLHYGLYARSWSWKCLFTGIWTI